MAEKALGRAGTSSAGDQVTVVEADRLGGAVTVAVGAVPEKECSVGGSGAVGALPSAIAMACCVVCCAMAWRCTGQPGVMAAAAEELAVVAMRDVEPLASDAVTVVEPVEVGSWELTASVVACSCSCLARRRASRVDLRPPCGRPRPQQRRIMSKFNMHSRSAARRRAS